MQFTVEKYEHTLILRGYVPGNLRSQFSLYLL